MITLNAPPAVTSVLGGTGTVSYDKFVLESINYNTVNMVVQAQVRITSTANPDMQAITGQLTITVGTGKLEIQVNQLDFYRRISMTGPQSTYVTDQIRATQNALEAGLVSLGVIAGTQATGA